MSKLKLLCIAILLAAVAIPLTAQQEAKGVSRGSLEGLVVIIDPGHGGSDTGAKIDFRGKKVTEAPYVYDVALRVARLVSAGGGIPVFTTHDEAEIRDWKPSQVFPYKPTATYTDGSIVHSNLWGLLERVRFGNKIYEDFAEFRKVWISIHFDSLPKHGNIAGVRIIRTTESGQLAQALINAFARYCHPRVSAPIVLNGDRRYGIRDMRVLRANNPVKEKVLVELGNFRNKKDAAGLRDPLVRENYARAIVEGFEDLMNQPP